MNLIAIISIVALPLFAIIFHQQRKLSILSQRYENLVKSTDHAFKRRSDASKKAWKTRKLKHNQDQNPIQDPDKEQQV